jgi:photosystem II stability/assembly factor-like uncharacterized protein
MDSECGNLAGLFSKPDEDMLIAGVAQKGLWSSTDGGQSWQALGTAAGSDTITNRPVAMVFDPDNSTAYYEAGIYNGGGVYKTTDDGATFKQLGNVTHSDLVSVDFTDPDRKTLLAGGHEQAMVLRRSTDGGANWEDIGSGLPSGEQCTYPHVVDAQTYLMGCNGKPGIYRTTDGASTWDSVSDEGGSKEPLHASDGSLYWSSADGSLVRSTDDGATWNQVATGGALKTARPIELPDRRIATLGSKNVIVSADHGVTWTLASADLPYEDAVGVVYSAAHKAFYIWHFTCGNSSVPVPNDAIMSFGFDYQK